MSFLKRLLNFSGASSSSSSTLIEEIKLGKISEFNHEHPHRRRVMLVKKIREFGHNCKVQEFRAVLKLLRKDVGMDHENSSTQIGYSFVVDPESVEMITRIANIQPSRIDSDWRQDLARYCDQLVAHFSPAATKSRETLNSKENDHTELLLTNVELSEHFPRRDFDKVKRFIDRNQDLKIVDLGYTGLKNENLLDLLPHLADLKSLTFLGLRGNILDDDIIDEILKCLQDMDMFPELKIIDLKNNEIFALPQNFLQLLQQRWRTVGNIPTLSDLSSAKAMLEEDLE